MPAAGACSAAGGAADWTFSPGSEDAGLVGMASVRESPTNVRVPAYGTHPKVVQELFGHSSIELTLQTYSHLLPTMQGLQHPRSIAYWARSTEIVGKEQ
jgi:hypothetical protein